MTRARLAVVLGVTITFIFTVAYSREEHVFGWYRGDPRAASG
jgi:hypothetical protein